MRFPAPFFACALALFSAESLFYTPAFAQDATSSQIQSDQPALLVADQVLVEGETRLIAVGSVEALQDGTRLQATQITYDRIGDTLDIVGPIRITDKDGNVMLADQAELDPKLRNGILYGARVVLNQQLQLAAVQAQREGRYTQLVKAAVTSCQVCGQTEVPLWQIRAERIVHDTVEKQLYFEKAQLRVLDVPVAYVPKLRLPDPTLKRARGFLVPTLTTTSLLSTGLKTPYFIPLGDHQDVTLTPYLSSDTRTLELGYRRAFAYGDVTVDGAMSSDTLVDDEFRGYIKINGAFDLAQDFKLEFDIEAVSDDSYLNDYDYLNGKERLDSALTLTRAKRDELIFGQMVHYESLRDSEDNSTQPTIISGLQYQRRLFPKSVPGELRLGGEAHGHYRYSDVSYDSDDDDDDVDGRDVSRLNMELSWQDRWTVFNGLRAGAEGYLWFDSYATRQDDSAESDVASAVGGSRVELRWPWERRGAGGSRTLLEPIFQIGWVSGERAGNANDESTRVEFDEGNLLTLSRFPAADRREHGFQMAAGLRFARQSQSGWNSSFTLARLWRAEEDDDFSVSSGLSNTASDWLMSFRVAETSGLAFLARSLFGTNGSVSKAGASAIWSNDRLGLDASYLHLIEDEDEDRDEAQSEWTLEASYDVTDYWTASTEWRYDVADDRLDRTGVGLQYQNECVEVTLSVTREFASADNLDPSTDLDLTVALKGFSTGGSAKEYRRICRN